MMEVEVRSKEELERFIRRFVVMNDFFVNDEGKLCTVSEMIDEVWMELRCSGRARVLLDELEVIVERVR